MAALTLLLLFIDVQAAHTSDKTETQQSLARSTGRPAPVGHKLMVYLGGDRTLASALKEQIALAVRAQDLPFDEVLFVNEIPVDSNENPFLAIHLDQDGGFWTPVFATRQVQATLLYFNGRPVKRADVLTPDPRGVTASFSAETCTGECSEGRRTLTLNSRTVGLVSLPHMRAYAASKVAQEAVTLVANGLPDHLSPAKWSDRASTLAREKLGAQQGGTFYSFQRLTGCHGGIVLVGTIGGGAEWSVMYYDAEGDAITEILTRSELQVKLPGVQLTDGPSFNSSQKSLYLGGGHLLTIPATTCGLSGWQIKGQ